MHATLAAPRLSRYLVELTPVHNGFDDIQAISARSRAACDELTEQNIAVRLLRSVFVPDDGSCYLLFEALSAEAVGQAARLAALSVGPVLELHGARRGGRR